MKHGKSQLSFTVCHGDGYFGKPRFEITARSFACHPYSNPCVSSWMDSAEYSASMDCFCTNWQSWLYCGDESVGVAVARRVFAMRSWVRYRCLVMWLVVLSLLSVLVECVGCAVYYVCCWVGAADGNTHPSSSVERLSILQELDRVASQST